MANRTHEITIFTAQCNISGWNIDAEAVLMKFYADNWQIVGQSESADSVTWTLYREVIHDDPPAAE